MSAADFATAVVLAVAFMTYQHSIRHHRPTAAVRLRLVIERAKALTALALVLGVLIKPLISPHRATRMDPPPAPPSSTGGQR
jgi:hypothetical protein